MPKNYKSASELVAANIIYELKIQEPDEISIEDIAAHYMVFYKEQPLTGCEGRLIRKGSTGIVTVNSRIPEAGRKRFVVAHELGHFLLHQTGDSFSLCSEDDMNLWYKKQRANERESNLFAGSLLMPDSIFKPMCITPQPSFSIVRELSTSFKTSLTSTAIRYIDFCTERCALICSEKGRIKWFFTTEDFGYYIGSGGEYLSDNVASDLFDGKAVLDAMVSVPASSWLRSDRIFRDAQIKEHSILLRNYGIALSLLWIDREIEEIEEDEE